MGGGGGSILISLPDETWEHKADYVPLSKGPARGENSGRAGCYVESWQWVRKLGEGTGSGLKSSRLENRRRFLTPQKTSALGRLGDRQDRGSLLIVHDGILLLSRALDGQNS